MDIATELRSLPSSTEWTIVSFTLGALYAFLFFFSVVGILQNLMYERHFQRIFFSFLFLGSGLRASRNIWAGLILIDAFKAEDEFVGVPVLWYPYHTLPSYLFLSCYTILLFFFLEIYHTVARSSGSTTMSIRRYRNTLLSVNVALYVVVLGIYVAHFIVWDVYGPPGDEHMDPHHVEETVQSLFNGGVYFAAVMIFVTYGLLLRKQLRRLNSNISGRVGYMMSVISCCFLARAVVTTMGAFRPINAMWWVFMMYYLLLEVLPMSMVLYAFAASNRGGGAAALCPCYRVKREQALDEIALLDKRGLPLRKQRHGSYTRSRSHG